MPRRKSRDARSSPASLASISFRRSADVKVGGCSAPSIGSSYASSKIGSAANLAPKYGLCCSFRQGHGMIVLPAEKMRQALVRAERGKVEATDIRLDFEAGDQAAAMEIEFRARA